MHLMGLVLHLECSIQEGVRGLVQGLFDLGLEDRGIVKIDKVGEGEAVAIILLALRVQAIVGWVSIIDVLLPLEGAMLADLGIRVLIAFLFGIFHLKLRILGSLSMHFTATWALVFLDPCRPSLSPVPPRSISFPLFAF